jgi:uncharacterized membrane protein
MFPAFVGIITVPISFLVFKKVFSIDTALLAAMLILFLPVHIYYSQELRSYSLAFLFATVSLGSLLWYLEEPTVKHRWMLAITCAILFATHYAAIFYVITILFIAVIGIDGKWQRKAIKAGRLILVALFLMYPNVPHFAYKRLTMGSFWPKPVTLVNIRNTMLYLFSTGIGGTFSGSMKEALPLALFYFVFIIIAIVSALRAKHKVSSRTVLYLSLLSTLPLLGVITVSLISPSVTILINRLILIFAPPILVLSAFGLTVISRKGYTAIVVFLYLGISGWLLYSSAYYTVPTKTNYRAVAHEVARLEKEQANILLISLNNYHVTVNRGVYYWQLFGVSNSERFLVPENVSADELLEHIRMAARRSNSNKIVLFSLDTGDHSFRKDIVELCDQHFHKEDEKVFGTEFLVSYSLNP